MTRASVAFKAGDPLPHDPDVDEWKYWVADIEDGRATRTRLDRSGRMPAGFNQMDIESTISADVVRELRRRGHHVNEVRPLGVSGCATVVMIDPATGNRLAAADPRRDCYAIAY